MDVLERFLRYVRYDTTSSEESETVPSTQGQRAFSEMLKGEMEALGLREVTLDAQGYLYATLPARGAGEICKCMGLLAHVDTSPAVSGAGVSPHVIDYAGGAIQLENGDCIDPAVYPSLAEYVGQRLVVSDGRTLLGADDKAGVAEILSAVAYLRAHPEIPHRALCICFTPDEEIGRGTDHIDLTRFSVPYAYTVDGGALGELEYENFNAASATLTVKGINIHPGSAKGKMKNAILLACEFLSMLPPAETPAHTEGYEGFYHVTDLSGNESEARISLLVRDHDREKFEERKEFLSRLVSYLAEKWGEGSFTLCVRDSYYNMREIVERYPEIVDRARDAFLGEGITPRVQPIRGGTDGARLSFMGIPCPNLSTGGENFHSVHEYIPVESMERMRDVLVRLLRV